MQAPDFVSLRLEENFAGKAPFIDLGNCDLKRLPEALAKFEWLEDINLGTVYWNEDTSTFQECINQGPLNQFGEEDFRLLLQLPKLRRLSLRSCQVRVLNGLAELKGLDSLTLGGNDLTSISPLSGMTHMKVLSLFDNALSDISPVAGMKELEILSLNYNKIEDISPLAGLSHLKELHLAGNQVLDVSPLAGLPALFRLNLTNNKIRIIQPLVNLPALKALAIDRNPVEDCPPEIAFSGHISRIKSYFGTLSKESEHLKNIPPEAPAAEQVSPVLPEVKLIFVGNATAGKSSISRILRNGRFREKESTTHGIQIYEWLLDGKELHRLLPEAGPKSPGLRINIWDFGGQEYYHGTHQIFLDNNAVYLLVWDRAHNHNSLETSVVYVRNIPQEMELEFFHYSYWLDNIRFHAVGESDRKKPEIVLLENKIDLYKGKPQLPDVDEMERYEVHQYAGISAKFANSGQPELRRYKYQFDIFREDLLQILLGKAQANTTLENLPTTWVQVRDFMRALRADNALLPSNPFVGYLHDKAWMEYPDFENACRTLNAQLTEEEIQTLAFYLHQIGAVVYLPNLDSKVYTDPSWLTSKIYKILNDKVRAVAGRFSSADVQALIGAESEVLLKLMREWEIIFPDGNADQQNWVAPQYLPEDHPMENLFNIALTGLQERFFMVRAPLFHYRKMLRRLIFLYGNDPEVESKQYWKNGILFVERGSNLRVFIKGIPDPENSRLSRLMICVEEGKLQSEAWRQRIFSDLLRIFLDKQSPSQYVESSAQWLNQSVGVAHLMENILQSNTNVQAPSPAQGVNPSDAYRDLLEISLDGVNFFNLSLILATARSGLSAILGPNNQRIRLQEFSPILASMQITPSQPTIFISYSHDDLDWRTELEKHLRPLQRSGKAKSWTDAMIEPGQNWKDAILRNLRSADIILLLVSSNFINSDFSWDIELKIAMDRQQRGECRVIPVLLKPCLWDDLGFDVLQMTPQAPDTARLKAITLWPDRDDALSSVAKVVKKALLDMNIE